MEAVADVLLNDLTDDEEFLQLVEQRGRRRMRRVHRERPNNFEKWNDREFKDRYRLPKLLVRDLIERIAPEITSNTEKNHALTPEEMVFITLRFLATGSMLRLIGDTDGIDISTVSRVVAKVTRAIATLRPMYISMPTNGAEMKTVMQGFFNISRFPRCIGAIDCSHIKISSPGGNEAENFRNRKGFFSINTQVVCDSTMRVQDIVCRWPGSAHDSTIFRNSRLRHDFENGVYDNGLLVGDAGYAVTNYLITPLRTVRTAVESLFNESQIRTRNPIERCFGVLKRRFPVLSLGIRLKLDTVEAVIVSCAVLHNIAHLYNDGDDFIVSEELEAAIEATVVEAEANERNEGLIRNAVRNLLIQDYFQNM